MIENHLISINSKENKSFKNKNYRADIDGLRAFAVSSVIINHFNADLLPNGYLGVDIFFVISGFVITSSVFQRPYKNFKDFLSGFYERRIKRLLPALSIFVLVTSIVICLFEEAPNFYLKTGLTSLFGLSNLFLLKHSTDYFAQSTELNVFAHTWSLGVEEQFYILFPFLVWFSGFVRKTKNGPRNFFLIIGALTIASLINFLYLYQRNQPAAYFLMPSRFWEMATGSLIFIAFKKRKSIEELLKKVPSFLVLALIVGIMYLPMSWAKESTVAIVVLSSVLIASLKKQTTIYKIFTHPKVVYIGLISYSLYLWHWFVLSISRLTIGIHWWSVPIQIAIIFGLAITTYKFIETPLRTGNWFRKRWKNLMIGLGFLVSFAGILVIFAKKQTIFLGTPKAPFGDQELKDIFWATKDCSSSQGSTNILNKTDFEDCFLISTSEGSLKDKTLFVYGDSYAQQIIPTLTTLSNESRYKVNIVFVQGCPSLSELDWSPRRLELCANTWRNYLKWVEKVGQKEDILLIANSSKYYFSELQMNRSQIINGVRVNREDSHKMLVNELQNTADVLRKNDMSLVVSSGIPYLKSSMCDQWFNKHNNMCKLDIKKNDQVKETRDIQLLAANKGKFLLLDFYSEIENFLLKNSFQKTSFFYYGKGHLNTSGVQYFISPLLIESLKDL